MKGFTTGSNVFCLQNICEQKIEVLNLQCVPSSEVNGNTTSLSPCNNLKNFMVIRSKKKKDKKTATNCMKIDVAEVKSMYVFLRDNLYKNCAFCHHCIVFTQKLFRCMCFQISCNFLTDFLQILSNSCRWKSSFSCNE